jgi:hypothetical protein
MTGQWTESTLTGSTWTLVAALPVEIDSYSITPLAQPVSPAFTRRTTMIHLQGRGEDGTRSEPKGWLHLAAAHGFLTSER